jgi:hypothetical protein
MYLTSLISLFFLKLWNSFSRGAWAFKSPLLALVQEVAEALAEVEEEWGVEWGVVWVEEWVEEWVAAKKPRRANLTSCTKPTTSALLVEAVGGIVEVGGELAEVETAVEAVAAAVEPAEAAAWLADHREEVVVLMAGASCTLVLTNRWVYLSVTIEVGISIRYDRFYPLEVKPARAGLNEQARFLSNAPRGLSARV